MRASLRWIWILTQAAIIVGLDQWTKSLVETRIPLGGSYTPFPALEPYFNIVHLTNTGAAFGLLRGQAGFFIVVAIIVIVALLVFARQLGDGDAFMRIALGMQLGGATGNLIDRLHQSGHVTDFLLFTLPVGNRVYQWPAWNVADACIVVGTILLAILLLRDDRRKAQEAEAESQPGVPGGVNAGSARGSDE
jgi:signal peptidase II